ncbi:MAG: transporter [Ignavibacteria bacterium]|nr:transporter [Ignavibacteria bacterium]
MKILIFTSLLLVFINSIYPCNICGGGTNDIAVLALDGKALFNIGFSRESFSGIWDKNRNWYKNDFSQNQYKITLGTAFRFTRQLQCALSVPVIFNHTSAANLKQHGVGLGDLTMMGRFEIFHEFQPKKKKKKIDIDKKLPHLAITGGFNFPTGRSEETAENDVDVTSSGFFSSIVGLSVTKSIIRQRFQIIGDLSWQHSFRKKYERYFGEPVSYNYSKQPGEKINYSVTFNYVFNNWHALSFSVTGFWQGKYKINHKSINNSEMQSIGLVVSYTYYPSVPFRITSSVKLTPRTNNLGLNSQTSDLFGINLTYYIARN